MNNYQIGQKIRMTDKINGRVVEGTIVDVKEDRLRGCSRRHAYSPPEIAVTWPVR